jgi:hypothetical protein
VTADDASATTFTTSGRVRELAGSVEALPRDGWPRNKDGTIARQSGVSSVSRTAVGRYTVTFSSSVSGCSWQATLTNLDQNGTLVSGSITTNASSTATQVRVATAFQGSAADESFSLAAFC